jgi:hypothetical protein
VKNIKGNPTIPYNLMNVPATTKKAAKLNWLFLIAT